MMMRSEKSDKVINQGTVLLTEEPFAFVLKGSLHDERCDYCFSRNDLLKCAGCSFAHYCDRDCQKKGWSYHKKECLNIKRISPKIVPDAARMLGRIIFKLEKGGAHERSFYSKTKFRVFKDLMSHYSEIKNDKQRMDHFISLKVILDEYLGEEVLPNTAELLSIYGRMVINSFNILDSEMQSIGIGLYLAASVVDHSCIPNAVAIFTGTTLSIKAVKNIPCLNWSQVFISYVDCLNLPAKRQKELNTMYYFLCQCPRCLDSKELNDMTSVICENKECANVILGGALDKESICTKCNKKISNERFAQIKDVINFTEQQLDNMKDVAFFALHGETDLDICRVCLSRQAGILHPLNIYNVKILDLAVESCISLENWEDALNFGLQVKEYIGKYYGDMHPIFGIFLMKLGKIALLIHKINVARKLYVEAGKILIVTHGETHPLIKNELNVSLQLCKNKN